jgi:hypothetical protein
MAIIRPAIRTPLGALLLEAWERPTDARIIAIIPGIIAISPTQGITARTKVIIAVIRAAIPRFCELLFLKSSMTIVFILFHSFKDINHILF